MRQDLDAQVELLEAGNSESDVAEARRLKVAILDIYEGLIYGTHCLTYREWASVLRLLVTKCGGLILKMKAMSHIFNLVFSVLCGAAGGETGERVKQTFGAVKTATYRDTYRIVMYFHLSCGGPSAYDRYMDMLEPETILSAIEIYHARNKGEKGGVSDPDASETLEQLTQNLWRDARTAYWKLKRDGIAVFDYDTVFESMKPPFPDYVFVDLAGHYEDIGYLPVGYDKGLFREKTLKNGSLFVQKPDLVDRLSLAFDHYGVFPSDWQIRWSQMDDEVRELYYSGISVKPTGNLILDYAPIASDTAAERLLQFIPQASQLDLAARKDLAHALDSYRVLFTVPLISASQYSQVPTEYDRFSMDLGFLDTLVEDFLQVRHEDFDFKPGSRFFAALERLQRLQSFFFFRTMFDPKTEASTTGYGLFAEACIDLAERNERNGKTEGKNKDWTKWMVGDDHHEVVIKDRSLFSYNPLTVKGTQVTVMNRSYASNTKGIVCYGYSPAGKPLLTPAYFCPEATHNTLNKVCFDSLRGQFAPSLERCLRLPSLAVRSRLGGSIQLVWRGQDVVSTDLQYWHVKLGHLSVEGIMRYQTVIGGMPPYFWEHSIVCEVCEGCYYGE